MERIELREIKNRIKKMKIPELKARLKVLEKNIGILTKEIIKRQKICFESKVELNEIAWELKERIGKVPKDNQLFELY